MRPISTPAWLLAASLLLVGRLGGAAAGLGGPLVDLGYSHYRGACDAQHRLNTWRGSVSSCHTFVLPHAPPPALKLCELSRILFR